MGPVKGEIFGACKDFAKIHCGLLTDIKVLDEADRLLAPSFSDDLAHLFGSLSKNRQTALFTATWTPSINSIADAAPKPGKQKPFIHKITSTYVMMPRFQGSLELKKRPQELRLLKLSSSIMSLSPLISEKAISFISFAILQSQ